MESLAGVTNITGSISLSLQNFEMTQQLNPLRSSHFIDVKSGVCIQQETNCPCECPGRGKCEERSGIKRCLPCPSSASYCFSPCPPGTVEQYNKKQDKVECKCRCADFSLRDYENGGICKVISSPSSSYLSFMYTHKMFS